MPEVDPTLGSCKVAGAKLNMLALQETSSEINMGRYEIRIKQTCTKRFSMT